MKWAEGRTTEHGKEKHGMALSWRQPGGINRFCIGITASLNCDVTVTIAVSHSHTLAFRCRWRASCNDMTPHVSLLAHAAGWWVVLTHRTKRGLESRCYANKERETNVHTHTLMQRKKSVAQRLYFHPCFDESAHQCWCGIWITCMKYAYVCVTVCDIYVELGWKEWIVT